MRQLYIGFSTHKRFSLFSYLIRKVEKTEFSHVYVRFDSEFLERTFIYQASGLLVNFQNINSFNNESKIIKEFKLNVPDNVYKNVLCFCIDQVGKPYSLKQIIGVGLDLFNKLFKLNIHNPFVNKTDAFICSEIGAYIVEIIENINIDNKDLVTPKMLFEHLSKME